MPTPTVLRVERAITMPIFWTCAGVCAAAMTLLIMWLAKLTIVAAWAHYTGGAR